MSTRSLPSRSTRGKRMNALVGDDALVDEEFWKMDMFKEDEEDDEYKSEAEEEDIIDADFDNPEEAESEEEVEVAKEKKEKKRMAYVDPKAKKGPKRRKIQDKAKALDAELLKGPESDVEVIMDEEPNEEKGEAPKAEPKKGRGGRRKKTPKALEIPEGEEGADAASPPSTPGSVPNTPKSTRKSTRAVAIQRAEQREKEREETEKKRSQRSRKRSPVVVRRITQEELLEEAKMTEIYNTESLKYILSMEEEKKKIKEAPTIVGPAIKYYSKDGKTCVCFDELPDVLASAPPTPPSREICPITGLPAKYKDPKTGICYANLDAFKTLRTKLLQQEEAETNLKIAQLTALLQESKRKKDQLQNTPTGVLV
eukprot:Phypoly_transcript_09236.p1 GENE.Phypoly_transcript_09236~~Phypoly_transcript_09236.p1  ORF type:complete len:369 (+),score=113.18 Phypoly_transcript_09236:131-1237(+)